MITVKVYEYEMQYGKYHLIRSFNTSPEKWIKKYAIIKDKHTSKDSYRIDLIKGRNVFLSIFTLNPFLLDDIEIK